jgi:hypothetical protein
MKITFEKVTDFGICSIEIEGGTLSVIVHKKDIEDGIMIESFIDFARELANFTNHSDFGFVKNVCNMYLDEDEKSELAEYLTLNT